MSSPKAFKSASGSDLFAHKLFAPPDYFGAIRREALLARVFAQDAPRIVVLQAPAGHGKSTVLQQSKTACEALGAATGWLTFDETENDLRRFSVHLQALLFSVGHQSFSEDILLTEDAQSSARTRRSDWFIDRLLKFDGPVALFLDEFQTLKNKAILSFFKELLERLPEHVRLFIGSRSMPEVGLARLQVNHQAILLDADALRFTSEEVEQFFSSAKDLWISREELDVIYRQTEGWPAALQLFRLSLVSPAVRKSLGGLGNYRPRELAEYLADNVLALQPPRIQNFLLKTSPLTRLSASLCNAITGWHNSQEMLLFLERSGLFLRSLDSGRCWFKYHNLFSSFLSEQLRETSEESVEEVHRRAAQWNRQNGYYEEAIYHAIEIHDYAFAADVFDTWATRLIADGYLITVERWFEHIPLEQLRNYPVLLVKTAYALVFLRRNKPLKSVLEILEARDASGKPGCPVDSHVVRAMAAIMNDEVELSFQIISEVDVYGQNPEGFDAFELGAAANLRGYMEMVRGNFDDARECLALARAYSARMSATFSGGYSIGVIGVNLVVQGALREALQRFHASLAEQKADFDKSFASASMVACFIWALYLADELDEAETLFSQYHDMIGDSVLLDFVAVAYISMVRIHDARNRPAKALELLDEAENIGYMNNWPRLIRGISWERVRRALMRGEIDRAQSLASRLRQDQPAAHPEWVLFSEDAENASIGEIRLCIHRGHGEEALDRLNILLEAPENQQRVHRRIKLFVLSALAHSRDGATRSARRCLRSALELAEPGRFMRPFLEEGDCVIDILRQEALTNHAQFDIDGITTPYMTFVDSLIDASGTSGARPRTQEDLQPLEPLTEKEKKILSCLSDGISNKAMAKQIFLSENTIKFHLKNIYSKLAVTSRVQAINAARQMGII